ncbi:glucose 1-dehydrogenase [Exiguobacterium sp. SH4S7]|uniref:glucose 1-dehydrogenase n=1 Tax=Exiguobacterium TaxID=33986 RepID=UPI0008778D6A|nr:MULTISPECIES: glucose 1-dehydrogenase [Exiguobacterium]TCI34538.1 glucose 1-dehydrogenase [Exiguobacterium sp. SH4S7]
MANYPELQGKVAVITGSSKGIGRAVAERYAKEGVSVVLNYRSSEDEMKEVIRGIEAAGGKAVAVQGDVAEEGLAEKMIEKAVSEFGQMDIFVNNAGVQVEAKTHEMELDNWQKIIDTNLTGTFLGVRAALKYFVEHDLKGNIINMSSVHEVIPRPGYTHYAASKGGVKMFTKSVALEYAPNQIRVNAIAPGAIDTPINEETMRDPEEKTGLEALIPTHKIGRPEQIAAVAAWLASDESSYVTGTTIFADGGLSLYPAFGPENKVQ